MRYFFLEMYNKEIVVNATKVIWENKIFTTSKNSDENNLFRRFEIPKPVQ